MRSFDAWSRSYERAIDNFIEIERNKLENWQCSLSSCNNCMIYNSVEELDFGRNAENFSHACTDRGIVSAIYASLASFLVLKTHSTMQMMKSL